MDFFTYDHNKFVAECAGADNRWLKKRELHYTRSVQAHFGGVGAGAGATLATGGAAIALPVISMRFLEVAWDKLRVVQIELVGRSQQLHITDGTDFLIGLGATYAGQLASLPMDGVIDSGFGLEWSHATAEVIKAVPGEIVTGAYVKVSCKKPPRKCPRNKRYDNLRLKCAQCSRHFDTSYTEWLHCCQCDEDYDVCASCAPTVEHSADHQLYKMTPSTPKVRSSWRQRCLFQQLRCNGCNAALENVDYYSCPQCHPRYDVCLSCYGAGHWCRQHREPLNRRHIKA